jgi:branched-chain amino acid transport system permease protein
VIYLFEGIVTGATYALVATGIVIIFNAVRTFQFAQGAIVVFASYVFLELYGPLGQSAWLTALVVAALICAGSVVMSVVAFEPLIGRPFPSLVASLGILLLLTEVVGRYFFSGQAVAYPASMQPAGTVHALGIDMSDSDLLVLAVAVVVLAVLDLLFHYSRIGMQMRAAADTRIGAQLCGIDPRRLVRIAFAVAGLVATIGGILLGISVGNINPDLGSSLTFEVAAAVLVAGSTSFRGAVLASVLIGVVESMTTGYLSGTYSDAFAWIVVIVVLLIRPQGLFEAPVEVDAEVA